MSYKLYEARFAPIDTPTRLGEFDAYCFASAQRDPASVFVDREHHDRHIGNVLRVFPAHGWWWAAFKLSHPAVEHGVAVGHPVSLACDALRTRRGVHEACKLQSISLVERPAIPGAEITSVIEIPERRVARAGEAPATLPYLEDPNVRRAVLAAAQRGVLIRHNCGYVTGVR